MVTKETSGLPMSTIALFEDTLDWLRINYDEFRFFVERDLVWTAQKRLSLQVAERDLPLSVFNDYPMLPGNRRSL